MQYEFKPGRVFMSWLALPLALILPAAAGAAWIVEDGVPRAQIVTADNPPRLVKLAAEELRDYIAKITGAELPLLSATDGGYPVTIFVGRSPATDARGITVDGLAHGAFRMLAGDDWLALVGYDADFEPVEPWPRNHGDRRRAQAAWEELVGATWRNPMNSLFRDHHRDSGIWTHDEGGSLQAVYAFLRDLGVRWYMPGDLGEVVPQSASIALPAVDRTVVPDFSYRDLRLGNVPQFPWDDFVWHLRLGLNDQGLAGSHGMNNIHGSRAMQAAHPEYYAMLGDGTRDTEFRGTGHACFSSQGLLAEAIAYSRARFDHFDLPAVSIFPQDGYRHCQCPDCAGQSPSDLVWGFVDKVARALYETYPDRIVLGGAYTSYRNPPESIERFGPNVAVRISWMRPGLDDDDNWRAYWEVVEAWASRLAPRRLMRNANIQWSASSAFPVIHPRSIARELAAMRGLAIGEASSVPRERDQRWQRPGLSHLNIYVLSRFMWDAGQDLDALLDEYYDLFYGPAAGDMRAAFEFAEAAYPRDGRPSAGRIPIEDRLRFVELLHAAHDIAGDTLYGRRIRTVLDDLQPLELLREQQALAEGRSDPRHFWALMPADERDWGKQGAVIDGKLDELFWTGYRSGGTLTVSRDGRRPRFGTYFQMRWSKNHMYIGIRCDEQEGEALNIPTDVPGDVAILDGDCVTVLLETQDHAFYEITVNPAGALWEFDHSEDGVGAAWSSQAEVAAHIGDGYWSVEIRIPVVDHDEDPLHWVAGRTPSHAFPWFFNVARRRVRDDEVEWTAYSPTDSDNIYDRMKFGQIYLRPSSRLRSALREDGVRN